MTLDTFTVVAAVVGSCAVAVIGWVFGTRDARRNRPFVQVYTKWRSAITAVLVVGAIAAAIAAPVISVLWVVVALNLLLGHRNNVPFSAYAMFSTPGTKSWSLQYEDPEGQPIVIGRMGLNPVVMQKRFETELSSVRGRGLGDMPAARRTAAAVLAADIERHRPSNGPLVDGTITIVLMEYSLQSGKVRVLRTPILDTSPP